MSGHGKLLVIGLDGASFAVLRAAASQQVVPTLSSLMQGGSVGVLESTVPPVTCPAWPSFATGCLPGKHGVFAFAKRTPSDGRWRMVRRTDVDAAAVWQYLSAAGVRVGVYNIPVTYPPDEVNGFFVSGFVVPEGRRDFVYPPQLAEELFEKFPRYAVNWPLVLPRRPSAEAMRRVGEVLQLNRLRLEALEFILDRRPVDCLMLNFEFIDKMCHFYFQIMASEPRSDEPAGVSELRRQLYRGLADIDAAVDRLIGRFGDSADVIVISDHGFGPIHHDFYLNHWLEKNGYLRKRTLRVLLRRLLRLLGAGPKTLHKLGLGASVEWLHSHPESNPLIDYGATKAYAGSLLEHAIHINLRGRQERGIVEPGREYLALRDEILQKMKQCKDPASGKPIFAGAWTRDEIMAGKYVQTAPDLLFILADGYHMAGGLGLSIVLRSGFLRNSPLAGVAGYHTRDGVLIMHGQSFRTGQKLRASIIDVAPTMLYLMDVAVPSVMDGEVIEQAIEPSLLQRRRPRREDVVVQRPSGESVVSPYTEQEEAEIARRLSELGYL